MIDTAIIISKKIGFMLLIQVLEFSKDRIEIYTCVVRMFSPKKIQSRLVNFK